MKKTKAVINLKIKMLSKNTSALMGPLMAIFMTVLMRVLYSSMVAENPEQMDMLMGMTLNMGLSFNIGMGAVMMSALPLAEEKEKHTLRTLMTSSVNGKQFFIGSITPPFVITVIVNYLLIFISGVNTANINFVTYSIVTAVGALTSCMIGLLIGLLSKSQVNANNIMTPVTMLLALLPTFASFNESVATISSYLYTGIAASMIDAISAGERFMLQNYQILILGLSVVAFTGLFMVYYRKNVLEIE